MTKTSGDMQFSLTVRQRQVVELIALGCSNEEVGERLGISARTAKAHCDVLRQKLGVPRRRQIPAAFRTLTGEVRGRIHRCQGGRLTKRAGEAPARQADG
jgi:DNA-binding CsgD family transcriptional regulator